MGSGGDPSTGGTAGSTGGTSPATSTGGLPVDRTGAFDWPEATPSEGACEAGVYEGTFTCDVTFFPGLPPGQITGPLKFALTPSANGEFLEIKDGRMDAVAVDSVPFGSELSGKLDCNTKGFHADTVNGTYGTAPFLGQFFGSLDGTLNSVTNTLSGTWTLTSGTKEMPQLTSCTGTWTSVKQ